MSPGQAARPAGPAGRVLGEVMARLNADMEHRAVALLELRGNENALEIGYGPGVGISALLAALPHGQVAGVDPSEVMRAQASRRAAGRGHTDLRVGGVSSLPWPDAAFDAVAAVNSAQFWPDPAADVAEVLRVLAPVGRVVIALRTGGRHGHPALVDRYASLLAERQLTVTRHRSDMRTGPAVFLVGHRTGHTRGH